MSVFAEDLQSTEPTISDAAPVETTASAVSADAVTEPESLLDSEPTVDETEATVPADTEAATVSPEPTEAANADTTVPGAITEATAPAETTDGTESTPHMDWADCSFHVPFSFWAFPILFQLATMPPISVQFSLFTGRKIS